MNYYLDTEFYEQGHLRPIELISIALVAEDGREFYAENADVDLNSLSDWLKTNVVPHLSRANPDKNRTPTIIEPHAKLGQEVLKFLDKDVKPIFYGYFADYDWVVFCQLFGAMIHLPPTFPYFCRDLKQMMAERGMSKPKLDALQKAAGPEHHALSDARVMKGYHKAVMQFDLYKEAR